MRDKLKIAVDAMGGDNAPEAVIDGVLTALKEVEAEIVLVGDEEKIKPLLKKVPYKPASLRWLDRFP